MSVREYPVPRKISASAALQPAVGGPTAHALRAARGGRVRRHQLPLLASCGWTAGSDWASEVLTREDAAQRRQRDALLASVGYDPESYVYQGVLDPGYPDHELIVSVARQADADSPIEKWDGMDWGTAEVSPDGLEYVVLDADVLADLLDALSSGSGGLMLRPFEPRAWVRDSEVLDHPVLTAAAPAYSTHAMVALPIDSTTASRLHDGSAEAVDPGDMHITLAYLGNTEEIPIDYQAVQRAVARWARRVGEFAGEISGPARFTAGEKPVSVALADIPDLPHARELLCRLLEEEGVGVVREHGYTPHITLAYDDADRDVPNEPLYFDHVAAHYGDDIQYYALGAPVVAAGTTPDIYYAIVDEFDTSAVLDLIRVLPGPIAYRRASGKWVKDDKILMRLMGADPPPVVEVSSDQADDVLSQVDSYDRENPEAVTAAVQWDESKYKRQGGKFAKKDGSSSGSRPATKAVATLSKGPKRPAPAPAPSRRPSGPSNRLESRTTRSLTRQATRQDLEERPWAALGMNWDADSKRSLDVGLGPKFWNAQPPGFRDWLVKFMKENQAEERRQGGGPKDKKKVSDDGRNEKGERTGEAGDGKRDVAKGDQRSSTAKEAQKKAAAAGGKKAGAKNLADWRKRVPPRYRKAMDAFLDAVAAKAGRRGGTADARPGEGVNNGGDDGGASRRVAHLDKMDRDFDTSFAQEGLGEARRREVFDRQLRAAADGLTRAGIDPGKARRVMAHKVEAEKRARADFERRRRTKAEAERVRRLKARNRESDAQAVTADASFMPDKLKKYWLSGEGAAKIRWGVGGDFNRCVRALAKYLKPGQTKGACANLHHLATGFYPGRGRDH